MTGFKKVILVGVAMCFCVPSAYATNSCFDGFYAGVRGGATETNASLNNQTVMNYTDFNNLFFESMDTTILSNTVHAYGTSGAGDIFLGYGQLINHSNFYVGGEIFGGITEDTPAKMTNMSATTQDITGIDNINAINTQVKAHFNNNVFGVDFRPGYVFDQHTMLYGRIGAAFTQATLDTNTTVTSSINNFMSPVTPLISSMSYSTNKDLIGLRLGFGIQHTISDKFSVTADYIYTNYGKVKSSSNGVVNTYNYDGDFINVEPGTISGQSSTTISTQSLMLGLSYRFA